MSFAITRTETPLLSTREWTQVFGGEDGNTLGLDQYDQINEVETILFADTGVEILDRGVDMGRNMLRIQTKEYPSHKGLWAPALFFQKVEDEYARTPYPFTVEDILDRLKRCEGLPYVWGGNYPPGVRDLVKMYPPRKYLGDTTMRKWSLQGVDCSGLLYWATDGGTPRNTAELRAFGEEISIQEKMQKQVIDILQPLDLICTQGHVRIVLAPNEGVIESVIAKPEDSYEGVRIMDTAESIQRILRSDLYPDVSIRRWKNAT